MNSPFACKLETNYCPTDDEVQEIQELLIIPCQQLDALDARVQEMRRAIDKVIERRNEILTYVAAHKALLSPIRRLPLDILQEIFISCLPGDRNCALNASEAPLVLGRVCSYWREITHSTPFLWSKLHFVDPSSTSGASPSSSCTRYKAQQWLDAASVWLTRSGCCPLSISLYGPGNPSAEALPHELEQGTVFRFLKALLPFSSRWSDLKFIMPKANLTALKQVSPSDVPLLKTLCLVDEGMGYHQFGDNWDRLCCLNLLGGPQLSRFDISALGILLGRLPLIWENLTEIDVDGTHTDAGEVLVALSKCSRLVSCAFAIGMGVTHSADIVELASLKNLTLRIAYSTSSLAFLHNLWAPSLRSFALVASSVNPELTVDIGTLSGFFRGTNELETFILSPDPFPGAFVIDVLQALPPTIKHLQLTPFVDQPLSNSSTLWSAAWAPSSVRTASSLDHVIEILTQPHICPNLNTFKLNSAHTSEKAVIAFVEARRLKNINITFHRPPEIGIKASFVGSQVVVNYPNHISFSSRAGLPTLL